MSKTTTPKRLSLSEASPELQNQKLTFAVPHTFGLDPAQPGVLLGLQLLAANREAKGHGIYIDARTLETAHEVAVAAGGKLKGYHTHNHGGPGTYYWGQDRSELDVAGFFSEIAIAKEQLTAGRFEFYKTFQADNKKEYDRLMEMAEKSPELLGLSVEVWGYAVYVGTDGVEYSQRPEEKELANEGLPTLRVTDLFAAAFVSDPAATSGLFAALGARKEKGMAAFKSFLAQLGFQLPEGSPANTPPAAPLVASKPLSVATTQTNDSATMKLIADLRAKYGADKSKLDAAMSIIGASATPETLTVAEIEVQLGTKEVTDLRTQLGTVTAERDTLRTQLGTKDATIADLQKKLDIAKSSGFQVDLGAGGGGPAGGEANPWSKATFNVTEQCRITKADPTRAAALKASAVK